MHLPYWRQWCHASGLNDDYGGGQSDDYGGSRGGDYGGGRGGDYGGSRVGDYGGGVMAGVCSSPAGGNGVVLVAVPPLPAAGGYTAPLTSVSRQCSSSGVLASDARCAAIPPAILTHTVSTNLYNFSYKYMFIFQSQMLYLFILYLFSEKLGFSLVV